MIIFVTHWEPGTVRPSLGTNQRTVWHDLTTFQGAERRARKYWPGKMVNLEFCQSDRPYSAPIRIVEFKA
jgi:hypothetical protein